MHDWALQGFFVPHGDCRCTPPPPYFVRTTIYNRNASQSVTKNGRRLAKLPALLAQRNRFSKRLPTLLWVFYDIIAKGFKSILLSRSVFGPWKMFHVPKTKKITARFFAVLAVNLPRRGKCFTRPFPGESVVRNAFTRESALLQKVFRRKIAVQNIFKGQMRFAKLQ